jgi:LemA protein
MIGMVILITLGLILLVAIGYGITVYNGLVQLRNNIERDWSNIDVLLKQRFDELPKLINVCEGYMQHEKRTLEAVIAARSHITSARTEGERLQAQNALTETLRSLFMVVERYPELKADKAFRQLQGRISEIEEMIADRREFYNEAVNTYNIRIEQFPDLLVARPLNFTSRTLWRIDPTHRQDVEVRFQQT